MPRARDQILVRLIAQGQSGGFVFSFRRWIVHPGLTVHRGAALGRRSYAGLLGRASIVPAQFANVVLTVVNGTFNLVPRAATLLTMTIATKAAIKAYSRDVIARRPSPFQRKLQT